MKRDGIGQLRGWDLPKAWAGPSWTTALAPSGLLCAPRVPVSGLPGSDKPGEALEKSIPRRLLQPGCPAPC